MPTIYPDAQLYEEYNKLSSFELCITAQETVQDFVHKIADFLAILKATNTFSLHSDQNSFLQRKQRLEETLSTFDIYFQRLRIIGALVHQRKVALDHHIELQERQEQVNINNQVYIDQLRKEQGDLREELKVKNQYLKLAIDRISEIIWQINSMQKIR